MSQSKKNCHPRYFNFTLKMKLAINVIVILYFCSSLFDSTLAVHSKHESVQVRTSKHRVRREVRTITYEIDGKDYQFNFEPSTRRVYSYDIPVWLVKSEPRSSPNYIYKRVPNTDRILSNGHFYVDNAQKAVAFVHYDEKNRDILYNGVFGENRKQYLIKSLSEYQNLKLQHSRQQENHVFQRTQRRNSHHISATVEKKRNKRFVDLLEEKAEKPLDVLYPKLLILVDNSLFKYHNSDIGATIRYIATFWNKVDQKFVELDSTNVQLLITGIIIADDEMAFNYVHGNRYESTDSSIMVNPYSMFEDMRMYFHHNFSKDLDFQNYDSAVLMTALDFGVIGGLTHLGKICGDWYNDIIVRDEGWFAGTHTASHELAHALGAKHDSLRSDSECPLRDENGGSSVMSPIGLSGDYYFWSNCTKRYLKEFTTVKAAECLATRHRIRHYKKDNDW